MDANKRSKRETETRRNLIENPRDSRFKSGTVLGEVRMNREKKVPRRQRTIHPINFVTSTGGRVPAPPLFSHLTSPGREGSPETYS
jgi:hypothetical protein